MAGPRHYDWSHIRIVGDREAAAPYVNEARKLMGYVQEDAQRMGLGVHKLRRELPDGTIIVAEKHGSIPRMTIIPAPAQRKQPRRVTHGFNLFWAGPDPTRTPILFNAPQNEPEDEDFRDWSASFLNSSAYGYGLVPDGRRGPPYIDVFGSKTAERSARLMPANGMWWHPDDEEVVSWFRGYNGYWPHHFRHPITNYADYVSIFGHVVYVTPTPAWRVLAAAKKDGWLYVMIAEDLGFMSPPLPPPTPAYSGDVWFSQPYDASPRTYSLWRYPLGVQADPETGVEVYRAGDHDETGEQLWTGSLELAYGAWSFNRDVTQCVTMQLPRKAVWKTPYEVVGNDWVPSGVESADYPEVEAARIELAIDHGLTGESPVVSLSTSVEPELIAEEDGVQLKIVEVEVVGLYARTEYQCDGWSVTATEVHNDPNIAGIAFYDRRVLVHAHIPTRTFLFYRWRTDVDPARYVEAGYELYVDGQRVPLAEEASIDEPYAAGLVDYALGSNFMHRMGLEYTGVPAWFRPMDAMTFLLGFTIRTQGALSATTPTSFAPNYGYQTCPLVPYSFFDGNYWPHSAAGGFIFGSVGGEPGTQYWDDFIFAELYGANSGAYLDDAPSSAPAISHLGTAASFGDHTMAVVGLQPLLSTNVGTASGALFTLAHANRTTRFGTGGDAESLFGPLYGAGNWNGGVLGHTGKARKHQRGMFEVNPTEGAR